MRNKISAIIIDKDYKEHNYDDIKTEQSNPTAETGFDIKVLTDTSDILNKLNVFRGFDCLITIGDDYDFEPLNCLSFEFRKKWIHYEHFDAEKISHGIIDTFFYNIDRTRDGEDKLFSIFTCTYKTPEKKLVRLYNSLQRQTYHNWNWWILDDSPNSATIQILENFHDARIHVIKNVNNHGNIGFNKHLIAMACDGDYLVEVDHDDELTDDCLAELLKVYLAKPDVSFVYSDTLELIDETYSMDYGDCFSHGQGCYRNEDINGKIYKVAITCPFINAKSIRTIYAEPNHVRSWKKTFYHEIGGHNIELSVLDDMDIIIRTFLYGRIGKANKVLYIQHEEGNRGSGTGNTQNVRFGEIQRTVWILKEKYDKAIHDRIIELGYTDPVWVEDGYSILNMECEKLDNMEL